MPTFNKRTGKPEPRRTFKGCAHLCSGYPWEDFRQCLSACITEAQTGSKRGYSKIPRKGAASCSKQCPRPTSACLKKCFKGKLVTPRTKESMADLWPGAKPSRRRRRA